MRKGQKQIWDRTPRRAQSSSYPPSPSPTPPRRTRQHDLLPFLSSPAIPPTRARHTQINKVTLRSHVPSVSVPPRTGGGPRGKGTVGLGSAEALTATASRQSTGPLRGPPARPRPTGARPASMQSPGRGAPAEQNTGSLARSLTTVSGDTMAAAAAAGTPLWAAAARTCLWPGEEATR